MEDQEIIPQSNPLDNFFNIAFDTNTRAMVKQAAVWAKVCALCGFFSYALTLGIAIFGPSLAAGTGVEISGAFRGGYIFGVLITTVIGCIMNYLLYRFAASTARGMDSMDNVKTNEGFNSLRIYFKIIGIFLIVILSLAGLFILFFILGMMFSRG